MPRQCQILSIRPFPASDPARAGKQDTAVLYQVDGTRTGRVVIPKEAPSEKEILDAIKEREKAIHPMMGKSYPL